VGLLKESSRFAAKARRTFQCFALRQARVLDLGEQASLVPPDDAFKKPRIGLYAPGYASDNDLERVKGVLHTYVEEECFHR
jgi:hypothetical protein